MKSVGTATATTTVEVVNDIYGTKTMVHVPRALPDVVRDLREIAERQRPDHEIVGVAVHLTGETLRIRLYPTACEEHVREVFEDLAAMTEAAAAVSQ